VGKLLRAGSYCAIFLVASLFAGTELQDALADKRAPSDWEFSFGPDVAEWGEVQMFVVEGTLLDGEIWRFRPYVNNEGEICIAYFAAGHGGGNCFVTGWAVEAELFRAGDHKLLFGTVAAEVARIRIPIRGGDALWIEPGDRVGDRGVFFKLFDASAPVLRSNEIAAFDEAGKKLGNEHWNVGRKGCEWAGPWDGSMDKTYGERIPACLQRSSN
jgi:hypothetical protein